MVFYVRGWHWSCWCWLLLITADCWWLLVVAGWLLVAAGILLVGGRVFEYFPGRWWFAVKTILRAKSLWIFSKRRWRNLAKTSSKIVLEYSEEEMKKFDENKFQNCLRIYRRGDEKDITENCLRIFSRRGNWNLVKTLLKNVLEYFQWEAIGIW